jgi:hypothetical protein
MLIRGLLSMGQIVVLALLMLAVAGAVCVERHQMSQNQNPPREEFAGDRESDRISLPPLQAEFLSSQGNFRFIVSTRDNWKSKQGRGRLMRQTDGGLEVVWEGLLPQEYGPRYVSIGRQGEVLMLDEWINVKSEYAVVVLNPQNNRVIQHSFDSVQEVLGVSTSAIVQSATGGSWWLSGPPRLDESGSEAYVPTAGTVLRVDLQTGELSL